MIQKNAHQERLTLNGRVLYSYKVLLPFQRLLESLLGRGHLNGGLIRASQSECVLIFSLSQAYLLQDNACLASTLFPLVCVTSLPDK